MTAEGTVAGSAHPVDMVFAYVDGTDPAHAQKRRAAGAAGESPARGANAPPGGPGGCDGHVGEITFSVRSVLKYLPWVRTVYIVTDRQMPPVDVELLASGRVRVVDHEEIIPRQYLPTFNSIAIESCLYRIPGLSEVFLYNNDDYMHFSPVPRDTFVTDRDGRASLELWSTRAIIRRLIHVLSDRAPGFLPRANVHTTGISHAFAWLRSRQGVRWHQVLVPRHVTQVLRVSTARRVEEEFAEALRRSREPRVRTREWVSYATLMYTMERQWHPYDRVRHWRPYDEASPIRMFDFLHHRSPATSDRVWRRIAESEARLVCLNNIRAFDRARFVATMKAKGLGEPLDGVAAAPADGMLTCHG